MARQIGQIEVVAFKVNSNTFKAETNTFKVKTYTFEVMKYNLKVNTCTAFR